MPISYKDIILKMAPILGLFIVEEAVAAMLVEEHTTLVLTVGLFLAFLSVLAVNIAVVISAIYKVEVDFPEILSACVPTLGIFIVSDAILFFVPEAERAYVCIFGMTLAFLAFCTILATAIIRKVV